LIESFISNFASLIWSYYLLGVNNSVGGLSVRGFFIGITSGNVILFIDNTRSANRVIFNRILFHIF
jgi:hypothetical protein